MAKTGSQAPHDSRERETARTDKEAYGRTVKRADLQIDKKINRQADRTTTCESDKQAGTRHIKKQMQTLKHISRQKNRQTQSKSSTQADRKRHKCEPADEPTGRPTKTTTQTNEKR